MADTELEALTAYTPSDDADVLYIVDVSTGVAHKLTVAQLKALVPTPTVSGTDSTQSNSTVTPASVTELETTLAPGIYRITGMIVWQSAATTTGASFFVRGNGGTVTRNVGHWYHVTTGGAAATGIADQATSVNTGQLIEGKSWRANNTDPTPCAGVDTANADELSAVDCIMTVTATTTLQLMFRSEVAGSAITIQPGTHLKIETVV